MAGKSIGVRQQEAARKAFEGAISTISADFDALVQVVEQNAKHLGDADARKAFNFLARLQGAAQQKVRIALEAGTVGRAFSLREEPDAPAVANTLLVEGSISQTAAPAPAENGRVWPNGVVIGVNGEPEGRLVGAPPRGGDRPPRRRQQPVNVPGDGDAFLDEEE